MTVRATDTQQSPSKSSQGELQTVRKEEAVSLMAKDSPEIVAGAGASGSNIPTQRIGARVKDKKNSESLSVEQRE